MSDELKQNISDYFVRGIRLVPYIFIAGMALCLAPIVIPTIVAMVCMGWCDKKFAEYKAKQETAE